MWSDYPSAARFVSRHVSKNDTKSLRWWIVEDALRDRKGHWSEYLRTFQRGLTAEGDQVRFFASRECTPELADEFAADTSLPKSIWARMSDGAPKLRRLLRIPAHGLATYRAISKLLAQCLPSQAPSISLPADRALPDIIFVPTVLVHHLAGWLPLIRFKLRNVSTQVLLFFPNAPVDLRQDGSSHLAPDPTAKLFALCIWALAKEVETGKVVLGAETKAMTAALSKVTGVPFTYLPHAVQPSGTSAPINRRLPKGTEHDPIVFGCYGVSRHEKGSDMLQRAIRSALESRPGMPARFVLQWTEDFRDDQGRTVALDPWLADHPKVNVIRNYFSEARYEAQLGETDVMMLPYRASYRLRVSRLLIEALTLGMPVIVTRGTTLWDQAADFGFAMGCDDGSAKSLADCIVSLVDNYGPSSEQARSLSALSKKHFSVEEFRRVLTSVGR